MFFFGWLNPGNTVPGFFLAIFLATGSSGHAGVIEDWLTDPVGRKGIPSGWTGEGFGGRADYDITIDQDAGRRVLNLKSRNEHSTISKDLTGKVNLQETPVLEWSWKTATLPTGGDLRRKETTDMAAALYVVWPRFPALLRSRIIGYVWDTTTPMATIAKSQKTGTVTFVVMRSGPADLGRWLTERRNVAEDYTKIFGEAPESPNVISISIDSNDTHSMAEFSIGTIVFRPR